MNSRLESSLEIYGIFVLLNKTPIIKFSQFKNFMGFLFY